eukprot:1359692-Rhodomonas_salina.1
MRDEEKGGGGERERESRIHPRLLSLGRVALHYRDCYPLSSRDARSSLQLLINRATLASCSPRALGI